MITVPPEVVLQIADFSTQEHPKEACGFVFFDGENYDVTKVINRSENPENCFEIASNELLEAIQTEKLLFCWHSHPKGSDRFSRQDVLSSEACEIPLAVYAVGKGGFSIYEPQIDMPLVGRPYNRATMNCVTIVRDFYRIKFGILSNEIPFTEEQLKMGYEAFRDVLFEYGFTENIDAPAYGDIVCMSIRSRGVNHIGVITQDLHMLHHLAGKTSCEDQYAGFWKDATIARFHKTFNVKE